MPVQVNDEQDFQVNILFNAGGAIHIPFPRPPPVRHENKAPSYSSTIQAQEYHSFALLRGGGGQSICWKDCCCFIVQGLGWDAALVIRLLMCIVQLKSHTAI